MLNSYQAFVCIILTRKMKQITFIVILFLYLYYAILYLYTSKRSTSQFYHFGRLSGSIWLSWEGIIAISALGLRQGARFFEQNPGRIVFTLFYADALDEERFFQEILYQVLTLEGQTCLLRRSYTNLVIKTHHQQFWKTFIYSSSYFQRSFVAASPNLCKRQRYFIQAIVGAIKG